MSTLQRKWLADISMTGLEVENLNIPVRTAKDETADAIGVGVHRLLGKIWMDGSAKWSSEATYGHRKIVLAATPLAEELSRII